MRIIKNLRVICGHRPGRFDIAIGAGCPTRTYRNVSFSSLIRMGYVSQMSQKANRRASDVAVTRGMGRDL